MYENVTLSTEATYDDEHVPPAMQWKALERVLGGTVLTGVPIGTSEHPGNGWSRLRWGDFLARSGGTLSSNPSLTRLHEGSWPVSIRPPPKAP